MVAYCHWKALFNDNVKIMFFSKGEKEAADLIGGGEKAVAGKARFIHSHLPDWLKLSIGRDTQQMIDFPATGSIMEALPSTKDAGRSTDATIVVVDEGEYHPYAESNFAAIAPCVDEGDAQIIMGSTADKTAMNTFFKKVYIGGRNGENNFKAIFLPYNLRPGRDEIWLENKRKEMPLWQVEGEYPALESEALSTLKSSPAFDLNMLTEMQADASDGIAHTLTEQYHGMVKIFKLPVVGRDYCLFTDPSDGKEDPHASVVIDAKTWEEVASSHGKVQADTCAIIHDSLARFYNKALNCYELNARAGGIFSQKMKELDTPNQMGFITGDGKVISDKTKKGWWTSKSQREKYILGVEEAIRLRSIIIHRKSALTEMSQFMRPEGDDYQAPSGGHDDWITCWGGVIQLKNYATHPVVSVSSFKYKES